MIFEIFLLLIVVGSIVLVIMENRKPYISLFWVMLLVVLPGAAVNEADGRLIPTPSQRHRGVVHYDDDYYYIGVVPNEGRPTFLPFRVEG